MIWIASITVSLLISLILVESANLKQLYSQARQVRTAEGHHAAQSLYQQLLKENPNDVTAATHIAACTSTLERQEQACHDCDPAKVQKLRAFLKQSRYTTRDIGQLFGVSDTNHKLYHAISPIYLTPAAAGSVTSLPFDIDSESSVSPLQCLTALFLLGLCVPVDTLNNSISEDVVTLLQELGFLFPSEIHENWMVPYVQVFPVETAENTTLYLVTDSHPRVLSSTRVGHHGEGNAVMYIGPDSLALAQHWLMSDSVPASSRRNLLDVCTGSGIQALAALQLDKANEATCLDINPRALQFTHFNTLLNGLQGKVQLVLADLTTGTASPWTPDTTPIQEEENMESSLLELLNDSFDLITANPPFLPVPPTILKSRHGLFSAGGSSGEAVLASTVRTASQLLSPFGMLAVVSEFFLQTDSAEALLQRLQLWWDKPTGHGVLLTNEYAVSAETYAERRADNAQEKDVWHLHLQDLDIGAASPGLLFIQKLNGDKGLSMEHQRVPKSEWGSIWTPSNPAAVEFCHHALRKQFSEIRPEDDDL